MRRGFKKWSDEQSLQLRKELNVSPHQHLPACVLANHLSIEVICPEDIPGLPQSHVDQLLHQDPNGWSALVVTANGCSVIIKNPQHSIARQESNVMHELAHILCKHEPVQFKGAPGIPLPFRQYRKEVEEEAGWLGACLQIPRSGLLTVMRQGMTTNEEIAQHFVASVDMVRYRRNTTGVDRQLKRATRYSRR